MRYIVTSLKNYVLNQKPQASSKTIIRIDGFENIRIYELFCSEINQYCEDNNIKLIAKLSYPKYLEFDNSRNPDFVSSILSMKQNGWIDMDDSLTQYRNELPKENEKLLVILMGTELIEDAGGIHDTYYINPSRIEADIRGGYSDIFNMCPWEADEKACINKLFKWLFDLVPTNIYKLSCFADQWQDVDNISMFISYFFKNLPAWNLCKREEQLPTINYILKTDRNLLLTNYDFIERNKFKSLTKPQFEKFDKKIIEYNNDPMQFSEQYSGWENQSIKSYDEYASVLSDFILGCNIEKLRTLLMGVDFAITEDVLNLKLEKPRKEKSAKSIKVYGDPLYAMLSTINSAILANKKATSIKQIEFNFIKARLVQQIDTSNNSNAELLEEAFKNICYHAGGIIEYISERNWCLGENDIDITIASESFLAPDNARKQVESGRVSSSGGSSTLNKIEFSLILKDNNDIELLDEIEYEWCFSNDESWLHSFVDICNKYKQLSEDYITSYIPFGTNNKLKQFMHLKSEQEFFDVYNQTEISLDNILDHIQKHQSEEQLKWKSEFISLGIMFVNFCKAISSRGFFGSFIEINAFIDAFIELGNKIINNTFAENLKWVLNFYIHAFAIEENNNSITVDVATDFCIIPPWHPIILQKLVHQSVFILDGYEQWWHKTISSGKDMLKVTQQAATSNLQELIHLSRIHQAVDIFPTSSRQYLGNLHTFGNFALCGNSDTQANIRIRDMLRKEVVFDDDFSDSEVTHIDADAFMIYDIIEDYLKAFPRKESELSIAFLNPSELQPIVAAIHKYINETKKRNNYSDRSLKVNLNILVKPENRGGRNYLSYWVNSFFSQDENIDIKISLNEWTSKNDIETFLPVNTDIAFVIDLLKEDHFGFDNAIDNITLRPSECKFPIVFKPVPLSRSSLKRRIELTQPQFEAATIHSQVVYYSNHLNEHPSKKVVVTKEVCIDAERRELIDTLHQKSYWVVCIDGGMDGAFLNKNAYGKNTYPIIGFSTGKGHHGQYNLTITARDSIVKQVTKRFKNRVRDLFRWTEERASAAAKICVKEASKLDGVCLLSAINHNSNNINEFMAYILTSVYIQQQKPREALNIIFNLDSYRHWFSKDAYYINRDEKSRPDFLNISAKLCDDGKLHLSATVIECKIAKYSNSEAHITKAITQVERGISVLSELFRPNTNGSVNDSVRRRYWYAQLYRALSFSQITFSDDTSDYHRLANGLKAILEGDYIIEWSGIVMGYWVDLQGNKTFSREYQTTMPLGKETKIEIEIVSVPQSVIQRIILGDNSAIVEYVDIQTAAIENSDSDNEEQVGYESNPKSTNTIYPNKGIIDKSDPNSSEKRKPITRNIINNTASEGDVGSQESSLTKSIKPIIQSEEAPRKLSMVEVYIGKDNKGNNVEWGFGQSKLSNRHLLITGTSGQGKTYLMQTMLRELSFQGISSMVFDYTEGFRLDQLEPEFVEHLEDKIVQKVIYFEGVPINPFRRHEIDVLGIKAYEKSADVATRIAEIFKNVYKFGDQQSSAIYTACKTGLDQYGDSMNMQIFRNELEKLNTNFSKTVLSKLTPFFDTVTFKNNKEYDWNSVTNSGGTLTIFQLTNFVRELQVIITEMMLWDAWHYKKKYGNKMKPFVVVLDEAQNLSHKANSPSAKILTEGRKFGWSAWFATQFLKPQLDDAEINRLQQAAFRFYFKPSDNDIAITSKQLGNTNWADTLRGLQKGQCIIAGERKKLNGDFGPMKPCVTKIASFKERAQKNEQY